MTVYLCVNVSDRTSRSRHSKFCKPNYMFMCICNYVAKYVNGLCYKILSSWFSYDMLQVYVVVDYDILCWQVYPYLVQNALDRLYFLVS